MENVFVIYPLVDWVVLAVMKPIIPVEHPRGRAGVDAVVVEHAIHRHVLPRSRHHLHRDVAHHCTHTNTSFFIYKAPSGDEDTLERTKTDMNVKNDLTKTAE